MDAKIARLMLENLVDRIERNPKTGKRYIGGAISDREFEAIAYALATMDDGATSIMPTNHVPLTERSIAGSEEVVVKPKGASLNLASLERDKPDDESVKLCLDFGTAMSKASATRDWGDGLLLLPIGQRAKEPHMKFPVSSTLYIGRDAKIYFGHEAIGKSLSEQNPGQLRYDSLKQDLSQGYFDDSFDFIDRPIGKEINPHPSIDFMRKELITLYLAFLTDLACSELASQNISRYVLRRFAMPFWSKERAQWAELRIKEMLARAQILADSFSGKWTGGLGVALVREKLDEVGELTKLPEYLIDQGVHEAVAAASSSLRGFKERRLYMVVDAGAGTTDYGLFIVAPPRSGDDQPRIAEILNTAKVLRQGGDMIDNILVRCILEQENIRPGDAEYDHVNSDLRLRDRILKENMFREGSASYSLSNDDVGSIRKDDFLGDERVVKFASNLKKTFQESLESAHHSWVEGLSDQGLTIILTGGSSRLPMVRELGNKSVRVHGRRLRCILAPDVPSWLTERYPDLKTEYPQLAVAIGGAAEELPEQLSQYGEFGKPTDEGPRRLPTHYKG